VRRINTLFSLLIIVISSSFCFAQQLAFPGAEGFGKYTTGGRGGKVYEVATLDDNNNPGSFRYAVNQSGARIIVFKISGTIFLKSGLSISRGDLTIAGQTAPGDGICIAGNTIQVSADNIIIRYLRFRLGDIYKVESDAIWGRNRKNIIIDHCSMSWSVDEAASFYGNQNFTMQWCIISESLYKSVHSKGNHGYGGIWGGINATFHHNLLAHHSSRNPRFAGGETTTCVNTDFRNNVIYNWGDNSAYGGEKGTINIVANYFKSGPATSSSSGKLYRIVEPYDTAARFYIDGNFVEGYPNVTANNWNGGVQGSRAAYITEKKMIEPFPHEPIEIDSAEEAFQSVLKKAGANFPKRDSVDERILEETRTGTAQYGATFRNGNKGIIDSQEEVGSWPVLNSTAAALDTDIDGMPDYYETAKNLNPNDPEDGKIVTASGYTNLELYLNGLVDGTVTSIAEEKLIPENFVLFQNYPNPFNPETTISYQLSTLTHVDLKIYDLLGRSIATLVNETQLPGNYKVKFSINEIPFNSALTSFTRQNRANSSLSSGVYFYRLKAGSFVQTKKMIITK
jgi:hypothetical protein